MGLSTNTRHSNPLLQPRMLVLAITLSAIALFVGTGGAALSNVLRVLQGVAVTNKVLSYALLVNISIILVGWYRYNLLSQELARRIAAEEEARGLADRDPLTGCRNRRSFLPAFELMLLDKDEPSGCVVLFMIDLDNFKQVNDRHGHAAGDRVLREVAGRLRMLQADGSIISRLGGDEFAYAVPLAGDYRNLAEEFARNMIDSIARPIDIAEHGVAVSLTMSVGLLASPRSEWKAAPCADQLLKQADIAMYRAKQEGRNRFLWFAPAMQAELEERHLLERDLRAGLAAGEFVPFYEQQVDLQTGAIVGFEMLARWQSPSRGLVRPDEFIPIAEETGLIAELSESLMAQALRDASEWCGELTLSVNVSPVQLRDPWFAQRVLKLLVQHNFPASRLNLEITESCLHDSLDEVKALLYSLRNQGVQVSLDDFGTGYASLTQLRDLTFDQLKIDRSFVSGIGQGDANKNIIDAILTLGRALNLPIVAEGIESEAVLQAIRSRGTLRGQGHHYGVPEDAEAVRARLQRIGMLRLPPRVERLPRSGEYSQDAPIACAG